jgi:hypothetical protein
MTAKTAPEPTMTAIVGFVRRLPDGAQVSVPEGHIMPADHAAVRAYPGAFVPTGAPTAEIARARVLLREAWERANPPRAPQPKHRAAARAVEWLAGSSKLAGHEAPLRHAFPWTRPGGVPDE